ncbi:paraquat-inducible protein A [Acinetobacter ihumii]|uniref:paraquat-inducible protein A n=1 Tax=Acinetobacter ihumii TaxID=2483802 RepID=UPI00102F75E8|nr:paraquat-inducible protein A [Acinetobacter ihumii]
MTKTHFQPLDHGQTEATDVEHPALPRAIDFSLVTCHCCGLLSRVSPEFLKNSGSTARCPRCHSHLHVRKPQSINRTLALVIAASILYVPANVLPMTITDSIFDTQKDTIMSGVIYFWQNQDYLVATVIFAASIFIPILKLLILCFLMMSVSMQSWGRWHFQPKHCTLLYRVVEFVGRWSMIDVFVVSMLTALIQIQSLATILAGPGAVAFGAVVILTMFASLSFDPRIIWDNYYANQATHSPHPDSMKTDMNHIATPSHLSPPN